MVSLPMTDRSKAPVQGLLWIFVNELRSTIYRIFINNFLFTYRRFGNRGIHRIRIRNEDTYIRIFNFEILFHIHIEKSAITMKSGRRLQFLFTYYFVLNNLFFRKAISFLQVFLAVEYRNAIQIEINVDNMKLRNY